MSEDGRLKTEVLPSSVFRPFINYAEIYPVRSIIYFISLPTVNYLQSYPETKIVAIQNIQKINSLASELEYEKATSLYLKLRVLVKEDKSHEPIRTHLRGLINDYEQNKWVDEDKITDNQIKESDLAEALVQAENEFYQKRKELIITNNKIKLTRKDFDLQMA